MRRGRDPRGKAPNASFSFVLSSEVEKNNQQKTKRERERKKKESEKIDEGLENDKKRKAHRNQCAKP